jgi:hypothetical protein
MKPKLPLTVNEQSRQKTYPDSDSVEGRNGLPIRKVVSHAFLNAFRNAFRHTFQALFCVFQHSHAEPEQRHRASHLREVAASSVANLQQQIETSKDEVQRRQIPHRVALQSSEQLRQHPALSRPRSPSWRSQHNHEFGHDGHEGLRIRLIVRLFSVACAGGTRFLQEAHAMRVLHVLVRHSWWGNELVGEGKVAQLYWSAAIVQRQWH